MTLSEIAKRYPTDKDYFHNYYNCVYESYLSPIKNSVQKVCEIGIGGFRKDLNWKAGNSLKIWRDYFPHAHVLGLDILDYQIDDMDRIQIEFFDQSQKDIVIEYSKKLQNYDFIIDDGSHNIFDQQITFAYFFNSLKSGGIYAIEDLQTSTWLELPVNANLEYGRSEYITTLEILEHYEEHKNLKVENEKIHVLNEEEIGCLQDNIASVKVFKICSSPDNFSITSIIRKN